MYKEAIKSEFTTIFEKIIDDKFLAIQKLEGLDKLKAMYQHLDEFEDFSRDMNIKLNELLDKYDVDFESVAESNEFADFMTPTFNVMYQKYIGQ